MDGVLVEDAVALVRAAVDGLLDGDLTAMSSAELVDLMSGLERERRRLDAVDARVLAEVGVRGVAGDFGRTSTADLLTCSLRVAPAEAKVRVRRALELGPRHEVSGAALEPVLPATAAALTAGDISVGHCAVISQCLEALPPLLPVPVFEIAESYLVDAARHEDPRALRQSATLLLTRLDPEGVEPREDRIERHRGFTLAQRGDGPITPSGTLTAVNGAVWQTILDALSAPQPSVDADGNPIADDRTPAQRRHDAFLEAGLRLLRSGTLPECGGTPVTVLIRATSQDLESPHGMVQTAHGSHVSTRSLLRLAGDTALCGIHIDTSGAVLDCGHTQRLATPPQRRALAARDGGCCFPGCTRPAAWCQVAHITAWAAGGPTDLDNLCLLCPHHHRRYDTGGTNGTERDWTIVMIDRTPHWLPPPWIDPHQRPIRNTAHHPPDIDFTPYASSA